MGGYKKDLQDIILKGNFEDPQREVNLALYHLESSVSFDTELSRLKEGLGQNIPIPHIIGYTLVCGIKIIINQHVLHPGPETVIIIEAAVEYIKSLGVTTGVLDLCTGSGSMAIVVSKECNTRATATDISKQALEVAATNAVRNNVQIEFMEGNLFQPVEGRKFDVIITNPPYVKTSEINALPIFIREFAPKIAIDGGHDGLLFHKEILSVAKKFLRENGCLFLECEDNQDKDVKILCQKHCWNIANEYQNRHGQIRGLKLTC